MGEGAHRIPLPATRRARVVIATMLVVALVIATVVVVSWQRSAGHQAGEFADSVRQMPGVQSATLQSESGAEHSRELKIRMSPSARRTQLDGVHRRIHGLSATLINRVIITIGTATVDLEPAAYGEFDSDDDTADIQWALRDLPHAGVRFGRRSIGVQRMRVVGSYPVISAAREIVRALNTARINPLSLEVSGNRGDLRLSPQIMLLGNHHENAAPVARTVLDDLNPVASAVSGGTLKDSWGELHLARGHGAAAGKVAAAARRAIRTLRAAGHVNQPTITVDGTGTAPDVTVDAASDVATCQQVTKKLRAKGWSIQAVSTDLSSLTIADSTTSDLPRLLRDLDHLKQPLPQNADLSVLAVSSPPDVFDGSPAELGRVAPRLVTLTKNGYRIGWRDRPRDVDVSVVLPEGTRLDADAFKAIAPRLRAIGWKGTADIIIQQRTGGSVPPYVKFSSTATGRTPQVTILESSPPDVPAKRVRRIWNSEATR